MGDFKNYSFSNVNAIFGILELEGFAEGDDVIGTVMEKEQFSDMAGAKGDVVRSQTNDNRVTITIKLLQTSKSVKALIDIYNADKELGTGVAPLNIEDKETGETFISLNAWITKIPDIKRGQNPNVMEFIFRADSFIPNVI